MLSLKLSFTKVGSLVFLGLMLLGAGCGGSQNNSQTSTPQIAFASSGSLDGSNASNNICQPFLTNHGILPTNGFNLWGVNASGTSLHPLTKLITCEISVNPVWSPDGSRIAFDSNRALDGHDGSNGTVLNIWLINADGSGITRLATPTTAASGPVWSSDGSTILFNGDGNIWKIRADGSAATQLTKLPQGTAFQGSLSPDGQKIVFGSAQALDGSNSFNTNFANNIWVMNPDGSSPHPLTSFTFALEVAEEPIWSNDGSKISFISNGALDGSDTSNMNINLWVMNPDGTNRTPLTKLTSADGNSVLASAWSPDSKRIAYISGGNIWVINADGTGNSQLTTFTNTATGSSPSWSPDSKQLVFASNNPIGITNNFNIWLINSDGSGLVPLTKYSLAGTSDNGGPGAFSPVWRP
ncbi:MAG TPA: hypothetical protein VKT33_04585 [Candidatus Angelobacter sp.]|nr:hypothetical protein [Candidatus Angelobacter sp.]